MLSASITHDLVAVDEALREPERLGDAARLLLVGVEEPLDAVLMPVAEQRKNSPACVPPVTSMISVIPAPTSASIA